MPAKKSRGAYHWSLTLNNQTDMVLFREQCEAAKGLERASAQVERAPTTGTLHIQAYIGYKDAKTLSTVQKSFPGVYAEVCHDPGATWEYTHKDDTRVAGFERFRMGTPPRAAVNRKGDRAQQNKNILEMGAVAAFHAGLVRPEHFLKVQASLAVIKAADNKFRKPPLETLDNHWYYGKTGLGKSRKAHEDHPDAFIKDPNQWWDMYNDQDTVIIDDLDLSHGYMARHLKMWGDHRPFKAQVKGGTLGDIRPRRIIVTSQYPITAIFNTEDATAIERRFKVIHF